MATWQSILKYASGGMIGLALLLAGVLNLTGITYSTDGDKVCTDCFSQINITSTYWEIKATYNINQPVIFRNSTARTLWINLYKVNEIVSTNPEIHVDLLVPATKSTSTIKSEEYGYLRELKEGDTLIKRNTKSNANPSKIYLHGIKGANQRVKWSFVINDLLMKDINIDPVWLPTATEYTFTKLCEQEEVFDTCFYLDYINTTYIHYNNATLKQETKVYQRINKVEYKCNPHLVDVNCKYVSIEVNGKLIEWQKIGWFCKLNGNILTCDAPHQSNRDGICQSGERCVTFDIDDLSKRTDIGISETKQIKNIEVT